MNKPTSKPKLSASARALVDLLAEEGPHAKSIRDAVHRTMLWRFTTGRRIPDLETATLVEKLTAGRVPANGWIAIKSMKRTGTDG